MGRAFLILHASKSILVRGSFMPLDLSFVLRDFLFNYSLFSAYSLASEWETWQDLYL